MAKARFYKTTLTVTVLSEYPLSPDMGLHSVNYLITEGDCTGEVELGESKAVSPKQMAKLLIAQGSDPSFFYLDHNGDPNPS